MLISTRNPKQRRMNHEPFPPQSRGVCGKHLLFLLLAVTMMLSACGGGASSVGGSSIPLTLAGNWQFTMAEQTDGNPADPVFQGGLQGGFLLENGGTVTGNLAYSVTSSTSVTGACNTGSAPITGTISGQTVTLTAVAGTETFTLTGILSLDNLSMSGTYTSVAGPLPGGSACGYSYTANGPQWYAKLVPPLTGALQGSFHSTGGAAGLNEQDFLLNGGFVQGDNTGASSTAITGSLTFVNPATSLSDYSCFSSVTVKGQISGDSVTLQLVGADGSTLGLIGGPAGSNSGINPVTLDPAGSGYILHGASPSYLVATNSCPGDLVSTASAGDFGDVCLALGNANACQQPVTLTPSALTFPPQVVGSPPTTQTITLANITSAIVGGLTLTLTNNSGSGNFAETDDCGPAGVASQGTPFNLGPRQSCSVTVAFTPQQACGSLLTECLSATLTVTNPNNNTIYNVPIVGNGLTTSAASTERLDPGVEGVSEASLFRITAVHQPWLESGREPGWFKPSYLRERGTSCRD